MNTAFRFLLFTLAAPLLGCYDFTVSGDNHTVTELTLLAIHAEPPYLDPKVPFTAEALFADPNGGGRTVSCAWKVDYFDPNLTSSDHPQVVFPETPGDTRIALPPLNLRLPDKDVNPALVLEVVLCGGEMRHPERIPGMSNAALFQSLCPKGPVDVGEKSVFPLNNDLVSLIGVSIDTPYDLLSQTNPRVDRLSINGIEMTAAEDGGAAHRLCDDRIPCDAPLSVAAYLDSGSIDMIPFRVDLEDAGVPSDTDPAADTEPDADTATSARYISEQHRIDWWVTAGALSSSWSSGSESRYVLETAQGAVGPYETEWALPNQPSDARFTLYVVARDLRGGNGWKTYRFYTEKK